MSEKLHFQGIGNPLASFAAMAQAAQPHSPNDYTGTDGMLHCGVCHEPKQGIKYIDFRDGNPPWELRHPRMCLCERTRKAEEDAYYEEKRHREQVARLRSIGLRRKEYARCTFDADDSPDAPISRTCRKYVAAWPKMYASNTGILFQGGVGTGKSFYACCIANALIEQEKRCMVVTLPDVISRMGGFDDERDEVLNEIARVSLLVIDDLGAERDSAYSVEQVFSVIDARSLSGKPTIITTNLGDNELTNPKDVRFARIYDRVLDMCPVRLKMAGPSRRAESFEARRQAARAALMEVEE